MNRWMCVSIALLCVNLIGCAPLTPRVEFDYDPSANFSALKTYAWAEQPGQRPKDDGLSENSLLDDRIRQAIQRALALKGLQTVESGAPNFLVSYHLKTQQHLANRYEPTFYSPYRRFAYGRWPGYYGMPLYANEPYYEEYQTQRLIVEFLEPQTHKAVWRGVLDEPLSDSGGDPIQQIAQLVSKLQYVFLHFPPTAWASPAP